MRFFADNSDYAKAVREQSTQQTNRQAHEEAAGMGLCDEFFVVSGIDPDAPHEEARDGR